MILIYILFYSYFRKDNPFYGPLIAACMATILVSGVGCDKEKKAIYEENNYDPTGEETGGKGANTTFLPCYVAADVDPEGVSPDMSYPLEAIKGHKCAVFSDEYVVNVRKLVAYVRQTILDTSYQFNLVGVARFIANVGYLYNNRDASSDNYRYLQPLAVEVSQASWLYMTSIDYIKQKLETKGVFEGYSDFPNPFPAMLSNPNKRVWVGEDNFTFLEKEAAWHNDPQLLDLSGMSSGKPTGQFFATRYYQDTTGYFSEEIERIAGEAGTHGEAVLSIPHSILFNKSTDGGSTFYPQIGPKRYSRKEHLGFELMALGHKLKYVRQQALEIAAGNHSVTPHAANDRNNKVLARMAWLLANMGPYSGEDSSGKLRAGPNWGPLFHVLSVSRVLLGNQAIPSAGLDVFLLHAFSIDQAKAIYDLWALGESNKTDGTISGDVYSDIPPSSIEQVQGMTLVDALYESARQDEEYGGSVILRYTDEDCSF